MEPGWHEDLLTKLRVLTLPRTNRERTVPGLPMEEAENGNGGLLKTLAIRQSFYQPRGPVRTIPPVRHVFDPPQGAESGPCE